MLGGYASVNAGLKFEEILAELNITESEFNEGVEIFGKLMQVYKESAVKISHAEFDLNKQACGTSSATP